MPHKGRKSAGGAKSSKEQCGDKKTPGAAKPGDKKTPDTAEKKPGSAGASTSAGASASASSTASGPSAAAAAGSSKVVASQEKTMKPTDAKAQHPPKAEPPKSTQTAKPKSTTTTTSSSTSISKPSTGKTSVKPEAKADSEKLKDSKISSSVAGKPSAAAVGAAVVGAAAVGAAAVGATAGAASIKPKEEVKKTEDKRSVSSDKTAAPAPSKSESGKDDALEALIDSLGGPDDVPEPPQFTGPEITETPATSEHLDKLGEKESTIPPKYRHLLDGKGEKPTDTPPKAADQGKEDKPKGPPPKAAEEGKGEKPQILPPKAAEEGKGEKPQILPPKAVEEDLGDDDLIAAMSSDLISSPAPPEQKKPKLEEKKAQPASSAPTRSSLPESTAISDDALDELLGTLESPPSNQPESPQFTGPEVTETITATRLDRLGDRDITIPPAYRHLLDGKDHEGNPIQPPVETPEPTISDSDVLDAFSKDFECSLSPAAPSPAPPSAAVLPKATTQDKPAKATTQDKQAKADVIVSSSARSVQAATTPSATPSAAPSAGVDDALDALMDTLEGPEFSAPESPVYTGPVVTETRTATHIEELGKKETTLPPAYRHLLDGKGEKPAPPPPEEKPLSEDDLLDELDKDFACPKPPAAQPPAAQPPAAQPPAAQPPAAQPALAAKPKDAEVKKTESEAVISSSSSSAVQAAPSKAATCKADPLDTLSGTLGVREKDPQDRKPVADKVKEKSGKASKEKLGEDEETIPPDYRLQEVKDKDGKPLLPKPEERPQSMSEDDLLDALTEGFVTSPAVSKSAPLQSTKVTGKPGSEEVISCSKVSSVQAGAPPPSKSGAQIPDDALDLLSGSLGTRQEDPNDNKPVVDVIKEKAKEKHIDKLGDRDETIPPDYRHLLDGKVQGQPAKPEVVKPKSPLDSDSAIDALSSGFASCDTGSTDKAKSSKEKTEKSTSGKPVSHSAGKTPDVPKDKTDKSTCSSPASKPAEKTSDASKDKTDKSTCSSPASKPAEKTCDASKPTSPSSSTQPSAPKTCRS